MCVASADATFLQAVQHCGRVDIKVFANSSERPAETVEADPLVHLGWGEAAPTHRNVVLVEDGTDGTAVDAEPVTQLVGRRTRSVALYQHLDLVLIELSRPPWLGPVGGQRRQG